MSASRELLTFRGSPLKVEEIKLPRELLEQTEGRKEFIGKSTPAFWKLIFFRIYCDYHNMGLLRGAESDIY